MDSDYLDDGDKGAEGEEAEEDDLFAVLDVGGEEDGEGEEHDYDVKSYGQGGGGGVEGDGGETGADYGTVPLHGDLDGVSRGFKEEWRRGRTG